MNREKAHKTLENKAKSLKALIDKKHETADALRTKVLETKIAKAKKVDENRAKAIKTLENKAKSLKALINKKMKSANTLRT